jgi:hypothetical protein
MEKSNCLFARMRMGMELELEWKGPYGVNVETPDGMSGLSGLYAVLYDSKIIYIGKSSSERQHLFQESKQRYIVLERALIELNQPLEYGNAQERREKLDKIAEAHCKKYVGILWDNSKIACLDSAEKLLIFIKKPEGNVKLKKEYKGEASVLAALVLEDYYVDMKDLSTEAIASLYN